VVMDATGNAALLEQVLATGLACEGVTFTNPVKQQLIDNLVLVLERGGLTFPPCRRCSRNCATTATRSRPQGR